MDNNLVNYSIAFMIYTYIGATLEHLSYAAQLVISPNRPPKALANPIITGFPLYGIVAFLMIMLSDYLKRMDITNPIIKFLIYGTCVTIVEYFVGVSQGAGKGSVQNGHINAWDYSAEPFNYKGIISLRHFISWGILCLLLEKVHPIIMDKISCS